MVTKRIAGLVCILSLVFNTATAQELKEISFGILSTESSQNLKQDWQPVIDDMSGRLGIKVNAFFAPDYAGVIEGLRFNKVHVAWLGNKSAVDAVERANSEVFAQTINADGSMGYYSFVSVHKDSPYQNLSEILAHAKNISFGMGDPNSTSGFLVPSYYLFALNNVNHKTAFKAVRGANHESNIMAVANRQIDAGIHSSDVLERVAPRQPDIAAQLRQVWKSPLIASDPMVWRKDLPPELKRKVKDFFLTYGRTGADAAREKAQLKKLTLGGFQDSSNAQLTPVRQLELFKEKLKLEVDTSPPSDDKKARLDEIHRKLADLAKS